MMKRNYTHKKGNPNANLVIFLDKMKELGYEFLTKVVVNTYRKKVVLFCETLTVAIDCEIGVMGFVPYEFSKENDGKTPLCYTAVRHIDMPSVRVNDPLSSVFTKTLRFQVNLGPCFVCLYITVPGTDKIRGIGFHGSEDDILSPTNGCIRLYNADLYLIRKLFFKNLKVIIV